MSTFVPQQLKTTKDYVRWTTITAFVTAMLWAVSFFYDEYKQAEHKKQEAKIAVAKLEEAAKTNTVKPPFSIEPIGGGPVPMPPPPQTTPKQAADSVPSTDIKVESNNSKFEIDAGLVKIAMENEASWTAIFKMVFSLLFTFFGIKLINFGFRKLERTMAS